MGGSSLLGEHALPLLAQTGLPTNAFTRSLPTVSCPGVTWRNADDWHGLTLDTFLSFAPVWVLPDYLERLASTHVKRVVVLSSTSRFAKQTSPDARERDVAQRLIRAEEQLEQWAIERQVEWVILRPTMIYGFGRDKNISQIARFIQRFGFFPLIGGGTGLRQPVHAGDVIQACLSAMSTPGLPSGGYNLSGGGSLAVSHDGEANIPGHGASGANAAPPCPGIKPGRFDHAVSAALSTSFKCAGGADERGLGV
ncbi:NAD-dependent epimerase/dehydratase family protein [Pseudomonas brassicacearum]